MASSFNLRVTQLALLLSIAGCQSNRMDAEPAFGTPLGSGSGASGSGGTISAAPTAGTTASTSAGTGVAVTTAGQGGGGTAGVTAPPVPTSGAGGTDGAAGSAETAGAGGEMATAGAGGAPATDRWADREDLGKGTGTDVVTIGDSWMDYFLGGGGIEGGLDRAGTNYRHYSLSGTQLLDGVIPSQYDRAKAANSDIKTVIMTGGGNDIMFDAGSCSTPERCTEKIKAISAGLNMLWTKMSGDGVKDVIYIRYSANAGTTPSENRPTMTDPIPICVSGPIICHTVDTTDLVGAGDLVDGIHPNRAANDKIAARILELMEMRKIRR